MVHIRRYIGHLLGGHNNSGTQTYHIVFPVEVQLPSFCFCFCGKPSKELWELKGSTNLPCRKKTWQTGKQVWTPLLPSSSIIFFALGNWTPELIFPHISKSWDLLLPKCPVFPFSKKLGDRFEYIPLRPRVVAVIWFTERYFLPWYEIVNPGISKFLLLFRKSSQPAVIPKTVWSPVLHLQVVWLPWPVHW